MKFYLRGRIDPLFSQDYTTAFFIGRWFHQYNAHFDLHFAPLSRKGPWEPPERPGCLLIRASLREWLSFVGWKRGCLELLEDLIGRRLFTLKLDRHQDWSAYDASRQMPRIEFSGGPCSTHMKT